MQEKSQAIASKQERKNQIEKVMSAFDSGDVDLARRILVASYRHHTRPELNVTESLNLMWCLAWFAFYEGCMEKGEMLVRQIIALEESLAVKREHRIIHAKFVLSIFCTNLGKISSAEQYKNEVKSILSSASFQSKNKELVLSELDSISQTRKISYLQTAEYPAHHLGANSTGHEPLFAVS